MKMQKVLCSGSFRTQPGKDIDRESFTNVEVLVPKLDQSYVDRLAAKYKEDPQTVEDNLVIQHSIRMFPMFLAKDDNYNNKNFQGVIKLYIDSVVDVDGEPKCAGKAIKKMDWEELQSLACAMNIREIPMFRRGSLRAAQEKAYETYMKVVKKRKVFKDPGKLSKYKDKVRRRLEYRFDTDDEGQLEHKEAVDKEIKDTVFFMMANPYKEGSKYKFADTPEIIPVPSNSKPKQASPEKGLGELSLIELKELALEKEIDASSVRSKAEVIKMIEDSEKELTI